MELLEIWTGSRHLTSTHNSGFYLPSALQHQWGRWCRRCLPHQPTTLFHLTNQTTTTGVLRNSFPVPSEDLPSIQFLLTGILFLLNSARGSKSGIPKPKRAPWLPWLKVRDLRSYRHLARGRQDGTILPATGLQPGSNRPSNCGLGAIVSLRNTMGYL